MESNAHNQVMSTEHQYGKRYRQHDVGGDDFTKSGSYDTSHKVASQDAVGNEGGQHTDPEVTAQERATDKCPACPHQLHGVMRNAWNISPAGWCCLSVQRR